MTRLTWFYCESRVNYNKMLRKSKINLCKISDKVQQEETGSIQRGCETGDDGSEGE